MLEAFKRASWLRIAIPAWHSRLSMFDSSPLGALIEKVTSASGFEHLQLPFAAIACDLLTGQRVVIDSGPLRDAVVASAAIPGLFEPVRRGSALLADGELVENVPVKATLDLGADYVLGVDILPINIEAAEPKELLDVIILSWEIVQHQGDADRQHPDLLVTPDVKGMSPWDFSRVEEAYEAGVAAMEIALPQLRRDLALGVPVSAPVADRNRR
jgi:NTE family protein